MAKETAESTRDLLIRTGTDLFRRAGFVATTVDQICEAAGVTKGAFFHHFESKEALAEACLAQWEEQVCALHERAPFQAIEDPLKRLFGCLDFFIEVFSNPKMTKSCLAGTTAQEVSETHPKLRDAAHACFVSGEKQFKAILDDACRSQKVRLDTAALARLWLATIQGSLLLAKASRDESVISSNLRQYKQYIESLFVRTRSKT